VRRLQTSWAIFRRSLEVLRKNKKLLLFPALASVCTLGVFLFFFAPVALQPTGYSYTDVEHWKAVGSSLLSGSLRAEMQATDDVADEAVTPNAAEKSRTPGTSLTSALSKWALVFLVPLYFTSIFLATFFNVAFYSEVLNALNGKPVSITGGLRFAATRVMQILRWSLLAGTVGCVIKALEEHLSFVGDFVARAVGLTWSIGCVFVVPIIVREEKQRNPIAYLKRSAAVIRQTWGEALVGFVGMRGVPLLFVAGLGIIWLITVVVSFIVLENHGATIAGVMLGGLALWILASVAFGYVCGVMERIYIGALYIYASEGVVPQGFEEETLDTAWKIRKR